TLPAAAPLKATPARATGKSRTARSMAQLQRKREPPPPGMDARWNAVPASRRRAGGPPPALRLRPHQGRRSVQRLGAGLRHERLAALPAVDGPAAVVRAAGAALAGDALVGRGQQALDLAQL